MECTSMQLISAKKVGESNCPIHYKQVIGSAKLQHFQHYPALGCLDPRGCVKIYRLKDSGSAKVFSVAFFLSAGSSFLPKLPTGKKIRPNETLSKPALFLGLASFGNFNFKLARF